MMVIMTLVDHDDTYLGLPLLLSKSKSKDFEFIVERVKKKVEGWKTRHLSMAGKEALIKSIVQSIPAYVMSCYEIPLVVIKEIHCIMARFWWGDSTTQNKIHWAKWEKLCKPNQEGGMGFRDLHTFNLALLAKQGWRLIRNPDSLVARILKALYFPNDTFMKAKIRPGASFVWMSILRGRKILENGLRYRVGDDGGIAVWDDKWIPMPYSFKPFKRTPEGEEDMLVKELIDSDRSWDLTRLHELFDEVEVDKIAGIPIARSATYDTLIWHYEANGLFSVKSGYMCLLTHPTNHTTSTSSSTSTRATGSLGDFWSELWKLKVPGKIKICVWRLMQGYIPTKTTIAARHIEVENFDCSLCGNFPETLNHLFRKCSLVRLFWKYVGIHVIEDEMELKVWCLEMMEQLGQRGREMKELFITSLWSIWMTRNQVAWNAHVFDPLFKAQWVIQYLESTKREKKSANRVGQREQTKWVCPPSGRLKINVDGAFNKGDNMGRIRVVVRNELGVGIAAEACHIKHAGSAFSVEIDACRWGFRLGIDQGWRNIILESDSILAIKSITSKDEDLSEVGLIATDCKCLIQCFDSVKVRHTFQEANRVAETIAKLAKANGLTCTWIGNVPATIQEVIDVDLYHVNFEDRSIGIMSPPNPIALHSSLNNITGRDRS